MNKYDVGIIGAGASGSACAVRLAQSGLKVVIYDTCEFPSKKLLVTGNGRCNLTNKHMTSEFFNQNIDLYLKKFDNNDTQNMFSSMGLVTYYDSEGRCYPISNSAKSVVNCFENQFNILKIKFFGNEKVIRINKEDNSYVIESEKHTSSCKNLIIASGLNDPMIYELNKMNIAFKPAMKSLVSLRTKENTKKLSGLRCSNVLVSAQVGKQRTSEVGEVLFKDAGLSGISIFNLSAIFARQRKYEGKISIDLLKDLNNEEIFSILLKNKSIFENAVNFLDGLFMSQVGREILVRSGIDLAKKCKDLSIGDIRKIIKIIKNFDFTINGAYDNNQVLSGGVLLNSLSNELESKDNKNLYFCGEICDVDGICGGYNLQWAWTSAYIISNHIIEKNN